MLDGTPHQLPAFQRFWKGTARFPHDFHNFSMFAIFFPMFAPFWSCFAPRFDSPVLPEPHRIELFPGELQHRQLRVRAHRGAADVGGQQGAFAEEVAHLQNHQLMRMGLGMMVNGD